MHMHMGSFIAICCMIGESLLGMLGNLGALLVFVRGRFGGGVLSVVLGGRALADLLVLALSCPVFLAQAALLEGSGYAAYVDALSGALELYVAPLSAVFRSVSLGLLAVVVAERWLAAFRPAAHAAHLTRAHALLALAAVLLFSFAFNLVRFWELQWGTGQRPRPRPLLANSSAYVVGYKTVAYTFSHYLLPVAALALLSACLCRVPSLSPSNSSTDQPHSRPLESEQEGRLRRSVVVLVVIYAVSYLPHFLLVVMEGARRGAGLSDGKTAGMRLAKDISRVLILANSAIPVLVFASLNLAFRREAKWYFLVCCLKRADRENEFTRSMRNLDRREGGSIRLDDLSKSQRQALRTSVYGKRLSERQASTDTHNRPPPPPVHISAPDEFDETDESAPIQHV